MVFLIILLIPITLVLRSSLFADASPFITKRKKHLKMNKEVEMLLPKKELIQVE